MKRGIGRFRGDMLAWRWLFTQRSAKPWTSESSGWRACCPVSIDHFMPTRLEALASANGATFRAAALSAPLCSSRHTRPEVITWPRRSRASGAIISLGATRGPLSRAGCFPNHFRVSAGAASFLARFLRNEKAPRVIRGALGMGRLLGEVARTRGDGLDIGIAIVAGHHASRLCRATEPLEQLLVVAVDVLG